MQKEALDFDAVICRHDNVDIWFTGGINYYERLQGYSNSLDSSTRLYLSRLNIL